MAASENRPSQAMQVASGLSDGLCVAVVLAVLAIGAHAAARPLAAPARLAALDPGGRLGANTIVAGATGGVVYVVPRRANFILALGAEETVRAAGIARDQIGALGADVTIRLGGGEALIYVGPGGTVIGGSGSELVIDDRPDGTVILDGRDDQVIASGPRDHIRCSASAGHEVVYENPATRSPSAAAAITTGSCPYPA